MKDLSIIMRLLGKNWGYIITDITEDNNDIVDILNQRLFTESNGLTGKPTNVSKNEIYDRIFFRVNSYFLLKKLNGVDTDDVFDMFKYVFSPQTRAVYHPYMLEHKENPATLTTDKKFEEYFERYWKRNQLSDHNLVWLEIIIDSSQVFLQKIIGKFLRPIFTTKTSHKE